MNNVIFFVSNCMCISSSQFYYIWSPFSIIGWGLSPFRLSPFTFAHLPSLCICSNLGEHMELCESGVAGYRLAYTHALPSHSTPVHYKPYNFSRLLHKIALRASDILLVLLFLWSMYYCCCALWRYDMIILVTSLFSLMWTATRRQ